MQGATGVLAEWPNGPAMIGVSTSIADPASNILDQHPEHVGFPYPERFDVTVGDGVGERLDDKHGRKNLCPRLATVAALPLERNIDLAAPLRQPGFAHHPVGGVKRAQAGAKGPP